MGLEERDITHDLIAIAVRLSLCEPTGVDHNAAGLALADVAAQFGRLFEGHPGRRGEAARDRLGPQQDDVHTAIGLAVVAERPSDAASGVGDSPWPRPWTNAALEIGDNAIGDARVDVRARFILFSAHDHDLRWRPRPSRPRHEVRRAGLGGPRTRIGAIAEPGFCWEGRNAVEDGEAVARTNQPDQHHHSGRRPRWVRLIFSLPLLFILRPRRA